MSAAEITDDEILGQRQTALDNGFSPLAILRGTKRPARDSWQDAAAISFVDLIAERAKHPHDDATGYLCGDVAPVDCDLLDRAHAAAIDALREKHLGATRFVRIGKKGSITLYRNRTPAKKITIAGFAPNAKEGDRPEKIELLGAGQQFVGHGLHVDTGKPYAWPDKSPLTDTIDELPEITPAQLEDFAIACKTELERLGFTSVAISGRHRSAAERGEMVKKNWPITRACLEEQLACIDPGQDRITWVRVGGGLKVADEYGLVTDPEFDGLEVFTKWSAGDYWKGKAPANFKDQEDCEYNWYTFDADKPNGSTLGTINHLARAGGYSGGSDKTIGEMFADVELDQQQDDGGDAFWETDQHNARNVETYLASWREAESDPFKSEPEEQIIPGLLGASGNHGALGKRGIGRKTLLLGSTGVQLALGGEWFGRKIEGEWCVLYVCGEDVLNTQAHITLWCIEHGLTQVPERFKFLSRSVDLTKVEDCRALVRYARELFGAKARVIVIIDTWQRAVMKGDASKAAVNQGPDIIAAHNLEKIGIALNAPTLTAYHPPKHSAATISGSQNIENMGSGLWLLDENEAGLIDLRVERLKGPGRDNVFTFEEKQGRYPHPTKPGKFISGAYLAKASFDAEQRKRAVEEYNDNHVDRALMALLAGGPIKDDKNGHEIVRAWLVKNDLPLTLDEVKKSILRLRGANRYWYRDSHEAHRTGQPTSLVKGARGEDGPVDLPKMAEIQALEVDAILREHSHKLHETRELAGLILEHRTKTPLYEQSSRAIDGMVELLKAGRDGHLKEFTAKRRNRHHVWVHPAMRQKHAEHLEKEGQK